VGNDTRANGEDHVAESQDCEDGGGPS